MLFLLRLSYELHPQTTSQRRLIKIMGTKPCREKKPSLSHPESGGVTFSPRAPPQGERQIAPWARSHPGQVGADFVNSAPSRAGKQFSRVIGSIRGPKSPVSLVGPAHCGCGQARACGRATAGPGPGCGCSVYPHEAARRFRTRGRCPSRQLKGKDRVSPALANGSGCCGRAVGHERGDAGCGSNFAMAQ